MIKGTIKNGLVIFAVAAAVAAVAFLRNTGAPAPPEAMTNHALATLDPRTKPIALPRMIDLGADKCIPCKKMAPILVELREAYAGKATIEFIDVWKSPEAGRPYEIRVIPTQIFFDREGNEVWRHEGFLAREDIVAKLKELGAGDV